MQQPRERVLQLIVTERVWLAEQDGHIVRERGTPLNRQCDGVDEIIHVHERLTMRGAARIHATRKLPLEDALNLMRQRDRMPAIVIDASNAQQHRTHAATFVANELLGSHLRLGVGPSRLNRPVLGDELAQRGRTMDEHGAGEHELFDLEVQFAQPSQHTPSTPHRDLVVFGAGLAQEVVVGGEVDDRCDMAPMMLVDLAQPLAHALVGGNLDGNVGAPGWRGRGRLAVETHDGLELSRQPAHHRVADSPVRSRHDDDAVVRCHA